MLRIIFGAPCDMMHGSRSASSIVHRGYIDIDDVAQIAEGFEASVGSFLPYFLQPHDILEQLRGFVWCRAVENSASEAFDRFIRWNAAKSPLTKRSLLALYDFKSQTIWIFELKIGFAESVRFFKGDIELR